MAELPPLTVLPIQFDQINETQTNINKITQFWKMEVMQINDLLAYFGRDNIVKY